MLLYVEGPDKAGKTEFILRAHRAFGWPYISMGAAAEFDKTTNMSDFFLGGHMHLLTLYEALRLKVGTLLVHRSLLTDWVYAPWTGRNPSTANIGRWLNCWPHDARIIFLSVSHQEYLKRSKTNAPDYVSLNDEARWDAIAARFREAMSQVNPVNVIYLYGGDDFADQIAVVLRRCTK